MKLTKATQLKWRLLFALLVLAGLSSPSVWALDCTPQTGAITFNLGNIVVQKDTPLQATLTPILSSAGSGYNCKYDGSSMYTGIKAYGIYTGKRDSPAKIYASNIAGVGFIIGATAAPIPAFFWVGTLISSPSGWYGDNWVFTGGAQAQDFSFSLTPSIQLYKTDELSSGTLSGKIGALIVGNDSPPTAWGPELPIYITGTVTKIACSLNSTSINVPLGDISVSKFTGPGLTLGDKGFDVGLTCDKDAKINVALAGTQNTETTETSVLALTNAGQAGTASGLGVQLLYGGTPLKINNNILLKTSPGGQETLPFTARYYQTKSLVMPGKANSSATLNITYQ